MGRSAFPRGDDTAWHLRSTADVPGPLRSAETGLSSDEARRRLEAHAPNELPALAKSSA